MFYGISIEKRRISIWFDDPDRARGIVGEEWRGVQACNFASPNDLRAINIRRVVDPLILGAVVGIVTNDHEMAACDFV